MRDLPGLMHGNRMAADEGSTSLTPRRHEWFSERTSTEGHYRYKGEWILHETP